MISNNLSDSNDHRSSKIVVSNSKKSFTYFACEKKTSQSRYKWLSMITVQRNIYLNQFYVMSRHVKVFNEERETSNGQRAIVEFHSVNSSLTLTDWIIGWSRRWKDDCCINLHKKKFHLQLCGKRKNNFNDIGKLKNMIEHLQNDVFFSIFPFYWKKNRWNKD